jgi:hypothetical protein
VTWAEGEQLEAFGAGLEHPRHLRCDPDRIEPIDLEDLVVELDPAGAGDDDVDLFCVLMPVRESLTSPGLDAVVADTRVLGFQVLVGEASLLDFVEAELGGGILDLGEVLVRVRSGRCGLLSARSSWRRTRTSSPRPLETGRSPGSHRSPVDSSIEADIPSIKPEGWPI